MKIPILNQPVKAKVQVLIFLDEMDRVQVQSSSKNLLTVLGLLEAASHIISRASEKKVDTNGDTKES